MSQDSPQEEEFDGSSLAVGIVAARFNSRLVDALLRNCVQVLLGANVPREHIQVVRVPGSNEIPYAVSMLANSGEYDVLVGLGVVIAGDTPHHEIIAHGTAAALHQIGVSTEVPVINGIIVTNTSEQAEARCLGEINRGHEFGLAALEMGLLGQQLVDHLDDLADALNEVEGEGPWDGLSEQGDPWKL